MSATRDLRLGGERGLGLSWSGVRHASTRIGRPLVYGALPALFLGVVIGFSIGNNFAFDFHQFWQGGRDVVEGRSPYPPAGSLPANGDPTLDAEAIQDVYRFPYPAPAALAMAPLGALPFPVAAALWTMLCVGAVAAALRLLGVRDWRCYGVTFLSIATLGAIRFGAFTALLLLGLAAAWRFRERVAIVAPIVAALIVAKLFLWPLLVWLALTRRFAAAALALAIALAATLASWAVLGFAGFTGYPDLLASLGASVQGKGWSVVALGLSLGLSAAAAKGTAVVAGAGVLAAAAFAPRGRRDLWVFTLAVVAAILCSPIVWLHYFLLLTAPVAIAFPRLAPAWLAPLMLWAWPFQETDGDVWKIGVGLSVMGVVAAGALTAPRARPS